MSCLDSGAQKKVCLLVVVGKDHSGVAHGLTLYFHYDAQVPLCSGYSNSHRFFAPVGYGLCPLSSYRHILREHYGWPSETSLILPIILIIELLNWR